MALHIVKQLKDDYTAHKVARELVIYTRRSGNQLQQSELLNFRNHIHSSIHRVQDWLHENLHKKVTLRVLADIAHMSERNFTRTFKKETSVTVNNYISTLRKERIQQLLNNPDITMNELARMCGLKSERQVSRIMGKGKK
jgi:transcriptional regulator GlxA family with amidase domain